MREIMGKNVCILLTLCCLALPWSGQAETGVTADEKVWKADDVVLQFKDEAFTWSQIKHLWSYMVEQDDPEKFEAMEDWGKGVAINEIGLTHLLAKKARAENLDQTNRYRARHYELLSRWMPEAYVLNVIHKEVDPTDAEILTMIAPATPEVQVRVLVAATAAEAAVFRDRIVAGEDMEALVKANSKGLSTYKGGLSGWLNVSTTAQFPEPVVERFLSAEVGQVLEPFYQDIGFLVVRVEGKHSAQDVEQAWLERNRKSFVENLRRERYEERIRELAQANDTIRYSEEELLGLSRDSLEDLQKTIVTIGEVAFSLETLMTDKMRMKEHGDDAIFNHVKKFLKRAYVTEEALRLGVELDAVARGRVEMQADRELGQLYKRKVVEEAMNREVTEVDIRSYYQENPQEFTEPAQRCLSLIELSTYEDVAAVGARLKEGDDFAEVARASSIADSRDQGGAIGCYHEDAIPGAILGAVRDLAPGALTYEPVAVSLRDGSSRWVFVRVEDVLNAAIVDFERVKRPVVEGRIRTRRRAEVLTNMTQLLAEEFGYANCYEPRRDGKE